MMLTNLAEAKKVRVRYMTNGEARQVKLENTGEIDLPQLDRSKFIGKRVKIVDVTEWQGKFGYYIRVETEILDEELGMAASRIFGLQKDKDGKVGWGKDTKLGYFLEKMGVQHYHDLIGQEVIIQTRQAKDGKEYLTF